VASIRGKYEADFTTAVGETSFKTPFLSEGYGSPFFITWAPLDSAPLKIT
jgi:hypothetical protein